MFQTQRSRSARRRRARGFTLIEVMLVLAILVILGSLVVANFSNVLVSSKVKTAKAQISNFELPLEMYQQDIGSYPTSQQGLEALRAPPADMVDPTKWHGPYLRKDIPLDPWDNAYIYELQGPAVYQIYSAGPDGQPGTDDDIGTVSG